MHMKLSATLSNSKRQRQFFIYKRSSQNRGIYRHTVEKDMDEVSEESQL